MRQKKKKKKNSNWGLELGPGCWGLGFGLGLSYSGLGPGLGLEKGWTRLQQWPTTFMDCLTHSPWFWIEGALQIFKKKWCIIWDIVQFSAPAIHTSFIGNCTNFKGISTVLSFSFGSLSTPLKEIRMWKLEAVFTVLTHKCIYFWLPLVRNGGPNNCFPKGILAQNLHNTYT